MDLSQQELPLTAYFLRGGKDARSRASSYKKKRKKKKKEEEEERPAEDSHLVARSSKSASRSRPRVTTLQLPTPATSSRKRKRAEHPEVPAKPQAAEDLLQLEFGPTPSKLPNRSRDGIPVPLATPSTDRRRTTRVPGLRHTDCEETAIERFPLARSRCQLPSASNPTLSGLPDSTGSTAGRLPVDLNCPDLFNERKKDDDFVQRDCAPPKTMDGQLPDDHVVPMIPVPSSQSQYLLHIDATPKRKRCSRRVETVISSQTQEERELTLLTPHKPTVLDRLSAGASPGKHMHGSAPTHGLSCNKQKGQLYTLGSTHVGQPIHSPTGQSRASMTVKAMVRLSTKLSSPTRRESASHHSPSCQKTPRRPLRHSSIENIPPTHIDDSVTESESESDTLQMKMKGKLSTLGSPSCQKNQVSGHLPSTRDARPPLLAGDNLAGAEDDSVTEAESDTEILRCVAEIGRKRLRDPPQVAREDSQPPPVISPLVSPARSRIAAEPPITGSTQFCTQEGTGLESCTPFPSTREQLQIPSESLPSVVRDFIHMFSGDESYPADFPESLRV